MSDRQHQAATAAATMAAAAAAAAAAGGGGGMPGGPTSAGTLPAGYMSDVLPAPGPFGPNYRSTPAGSFMMGNIPDQLLLGLGGSAGDLSAGLSPRRAYGGTLSPALTSLGNRMGGESALGGFTGRPMDAAPRGAAGGSRPGAEGLTHGMHSFPGLDLTGVGVGALLGQPTGHVSALSGFGNDAGMQSSRAANGAGQGADTDVGSLLLQLQMAGLEPDTAHAVVLQQYQNQQQQQQLGLGNAGVHLPAHAGVGPMTTSALPFYSDESLFSNASQALVSSDASASGSGVGFLDGRGTPGLLVNPSPGGAFLSNSSTPPPGPGMVLGPHTFLQPPSRGPSSHSSLDGDGMRTSAGSNMQYDMARGIKSSPPAMVF